MSASAKPALLIAEQRFDDPVLGAEVSFEVVEGSSEPYRLRFRFHGSDEVRELRFDADGVKSGSGLLLKGRF